MTNQPFQYSCLENSMDREASANLCRLKEVSFLLLKKDHVCHRAEKKVLSIYFYLLVSPRKPNQNKKIRKEQNIIIEKRLIST